MRQVACQFFSPSVFRFESQQFYPMYKYHIFLNQFYFFIFYETILEVTPKLLNLSSVTPIINLFISSVTKSLFPNLESWLFYIFKNGFISILQR